jgi:hypothetical protein
VLAELEDLGYDGYVGLEFNPATGTTEESFGWLPEELRGGDVRVTDLKLSIGRASWRRRWGSSGSGSWANRWRRT